MLVIISRKNWLASAENFQGLALMLLLCTDVSSAYCLPLRQFVGVSSLSLQFHQWHTHDHCRCEAEWPRINEHTLFLTGLRNRASKVWYHASLKLRIDNLQICSLNVSIPRIDYCRIYTLQSIKLSYGNFVCRVKSVALYTMKWSAFSTINAHWEGADIGDKQWVPWNSCLVHHLGFRTEECQD